jgi:hypothetical protein
MQVVSRFRGVIATGLLMLTVGFVVTAKSGDTMAPTETETRVGSL